ncbi:MAG: uncharacterized protein A8A55_3083, partial [Amphiamblys sp. WSBS2006]
MGSKDAEGTAQISRMETTTDTRSGNEPIHPQEDGRGDVTPGGDYPAVNRGIDGKPSEEEEQDVMNLADEVNEAVQQAEEEVAARIAAEKREAEMLAGEELLDTEMDEEKETEPETERIQALRARRERCAANCANLELGIAEDKEVIARMER